MEPSPPHACPYLPDREIALNVGVAIPDGCFFDALMASGHRRLGQVFYTPDCSGCRQCVPIRVPTQSFSPSKSQRRLLNRVEHLFDVLVLPPHFSQEHFELYERHAAYVSEDNAPSTPTDYAQAFLGTHTQTHVVEYRIEDHLVAASILDAGHRSLSSVYVYWDPDLADLSPGTFSALWELKWALSQGKEHYYLGYWVADCSRMSYKNRFRPYELMDWRTGTWHPKHQAPPEDWPSSDGPSEDGAHDPPL